MHGMRLCWGVAILFSAGFIGTANADILDVAGSAKGVFYDSSHANEGTSISHLSFTGASFGPTTNDSLNLGTFDLSNGTNTYTGDTFDLTVTFTAPSGTKGTAFTADLTGSVHGNSGSVTLDFNAPVLFTFPGGFFDLTVNDLTIADGTPATLTGTLSNEDPVVPEPASWALLSTGAALLVLARLTRKRSVSA